MHIYLFGLDVSLSGFIATFGALVAVLFLRRLLPAGQRQKGKGPLIFLALSLCVRIASYACELGGAHGASVFLNNLAFLLLAFGIAGVGRMLVFDISLIRVGWRVPNTLQDILQALAFLIISMGVLRRAGLNLMGMITTSAVLTAVIGLALQGTIANMFAGLSLQLDRTINVGDWIQIGEIGQVARITQIKWRSTFMVNRDGDTIVVPNGEIIRAHVLNYTKPTREHRNWIKVGFHYRHPPNEVARILGDAVRGTPGVLDEPAPDCIATGFADSHVDYAVRYWLTDIAREPDIDGEVRARIWYAAQRSGLEIPFPQRVVSMTQVTAEEQARAEERETRERAKALAVIDLLAPLDEADRDALARGTRKLNYTAGEIIIRQGDPGDSLFVIARGEVVVRLAVDGVQREVASLKEEQVFGEMSLMTGEPRTATCVARTEVTCFMVGHGAFRRILEQKPKIAEDISSILATRQSALEGEREGLSAEARSRRAAEARSKVLGRIRDFFHLG